MTPGPSPESGPSIILAKYVIYTVISYYHFSNNMIFSSLSTMSSAFLYRDRLRIHPEFRAPSPSTVTYPSDTHAYRVGRLRGSCRILPEKLFFSFFFKSLFVPISNSPESTPPNPFVDNKTHIIYMFTFCLRVQHRSFRPRRTYASR